MKQLILIIAFLCVGPLNLMAGTRKVSLHVTDAAAERVFSDIVRQTGMNFVYPAGLLDSMEVTVNAENKPIRHVLDSMFGNTGIEYRIKGSNVILSLRRKSVAESVAKLFTVSGFIKEAGSAEALAGAVVTAVSGGISTSANANGFYSLTLPEGHVRLNVSYPGYNTHITESWPLTDHVRRDFSLTAGRELDEVEVVETRNAHLALQSPDLGHYHLSTATIGNVTGLFGENDMVKALQMQPGVSFGSEGTAGMYVHGGNADENLYMLDNIPLYQVNHFGGMFSAFNTGAIRNVDFYKSSFPAKYDGRLSSFTDVHTRDGSLSSHHGSFQLGSMSASLSVDGPIRRGRTSYLLSIRRTWQELIAWPILAMVNSGENEKTNFGYMFMDANAKITHHFSDRSRAYVMFYYGYDRLHGGSESQFTFDDSSDYDKDDQRMRWGNTVLSVGWNYVLTHNLFGEFTAAYSRYASHMSTDMLNRQCSDGEERLSQSIIKSDNNITDWIFRADFDWRPDTRQKINFGASYTRHSFLPSRTNRISVVDSFRSEMLDSVWAYRANEASAYISDDWTVNDRLRVNAGLNVSLFSIDSRTHGAISPRLSLRYTLSPRWAVKSSYSRAVQYVHQLTQGYISLPSDQWVPVTGSFKPQTSDKLSAGVYYVSPNGCWTLSAEAFYKWMHNLVEYVDEYYLISPRLAWNARLTAGSGEAHGLDIKLSKEVGRLTGHIGYSLLWANRTFAEKNGGRTYPARFDNRHKLVLSLNWRASRKWDINVQWTGMSGNRLTLPTQMWTSPDFDGGDYYEVPLRTDLNNYRLPFYHRLDLGFKRYTRRGYWTFGLYNAYCHMNVVSVNRGTVYPGSRPVFQQLHLLPIIPSISYTWQF